MASTTDIPLSQWVHVAGTYDGVQMRIYIDGQLNNTLPVTGVIQDTPNPIIVGTSQFWPRAFDGKIDEVKVYNRSLSADEVAGLYNEAVGPVVPSAPTTLVATELSSTEVELTWQDNSGNEDGFIIERQENGGGYSELTTTSADVTSYNDLTVGAGISYDYRIKAINGAGESAESNVASIYILPIPSAPTTPLRIVKSA